MSIARTPADSLRARMLATAEPDNPNHRIAMRLLDEHASGLWLIRLGAPAAHYCRPGTAFLDWQRVSLALTAGELAADATGLAVLAVAASLALDHEINLKEILGVLDRRDRRLVLKAVCAVPTA